MIKWGTHLMRFLHVWVCQQFLFFLFNNSVVYFDGRHIALTFLRFEFESLSDAQIVYFVQFSNPV